MNYTKEVLIEYQIQREENKSKQAQRKAQVYQDIPEFKEIDNTISTLGVEIAKMVLNNPGAITAQLKELRSSVDYAKKRKKQLLLNSGFSADFLDVEVQCAKCKDTGYVSGNTKCQCFKQKLVQKAYKMSNIKSQMELENFSTFNLDVFSNKKLPNESSTQKENMLINLSECESFLLNFETEFVNLYLYGPPGLGKTFLCNSIAKALIDKGNTVLYQTPFSIIDIIQKKTFGNKNDYAIEEAYGFLFNVDLLIIDDLGVENANSFTKSEFFNIFNSRLINNKSTIISTNIFPTRFVDIYSERIDSRIKGNYKYLKFYGPDIRWEKI